MKSSRRLALAAPLAAGLLLALSGPAAAQWKPAKPITIIVPWAAGGATDQVTRLADHASPERLLRCIEAVLACREALAMNVKPKFAVDALVATVGQALRPEG